MPFYDSHNFLQNVLQTVSNSDTFRFPARIAGRCEPAWRRKAPCVYPATFSTPRSTSSFWSGTPSVQNPAPQGASRLSALGGAGTPPPSIGGDTEAHSAKQGRSLVSGPAVVGVGSEQRQLSGAGGCVFRNYDRQGSRHLAVHRCLDRRRWRYICRNLSPQFCVRTTTQYRVHAVT